MGTHYRTALMFATALVVAAFAVISAVGSGGAVVGTAQAASAPPAAQGAPAAASVNTATVAHWRNLAKKFEKVATNHKSRADRLAKERAELQRTNRILRSTIAGSWKSGHTAWDKLAVKELKRQGCTKEDIRMAMAIHHAEGGPNSDTGKYHGGWQFNPSIAHGNPWWDPEWSTERAVKYMRGRYGSIAAAYAHKKREGWY